MPSLYGRIVDRSSGFAVSKPCGRVRTVAKVLCAKAVRTYRAVAKALRAKRSSEQAKRPRLRLALS